MAVAGVLAALATGCGRAGGDGVSLAAGPARGGELLVAVRELPDSPDPHVAPGPHLAHRLVYETLLVRGPLAAAGEGVASALALYPHLATCWAVSPDGRAIEFLVRPGVTFHDGTVLDAEAVRANLERVMALPPGTPSRDLLADLAGVEVADSHRLRLILRRANPAIWNALASPLLSMVSPGTWETGRWAGTGPYALRSWGAETVALDRNEAYAWPPDFYGNAGPPHPGGVTMVRWQEGTPDAHLWFDVEGPRTLRVGGEGLLYLCFNLRDGVTANPAVRRAVAHAVDRASLAAAAGPGWIPAYSPLAPGIWGHDPATAGFAPRASAEDARATLAGDGWLRSIEDGPFHRDGAVLRLELLVQDRPAAVAAAEALVGQLAVAGIPARLEVRSPGEALAQAARGRFQILLASYQWAPDADVLHYFFHSSREGTTNRGAYRSPEVDRLLDAGRREMQPQVRWLVYSRLQRLVLNDLPWVPLLAEGRLLGLDPDRLCGVLAGPAGELWLHDAWLPEAGR